jgi:hypothetical protein
MATQALQAVNHLLGDEDLLNRSPGETTPKLQQVQSKAGAAAAPAHTAQAVAHRKLASPKKQPYAVRSSSSARRRHTHIAAGVLEDDSKPCNFTDIGYGLLAPNVLLRPPFSQF